MSETDEVGSAVEPKPLPKKRSRRAKAADQKARSRATSEAHRRKLEAANVPDRDVFATVLFNLFISRLAKGSPGAIKVANDVIRELSQAYDRQATVGRLKGMAAREKAKQRRNLADEAGDPSSTSGRPDVVTSRI